MIKGVLLSPLKVISNPKGDIYHAFKKSDKGYFSFGEAYFTNVNYAEIKGWKMHSKMVLNLVVPVGEIRFVIFDDRTYSKTKGEFDSYHLSIDNYQRLTIEPNLWLAFQGIGKSQNMLLNIANIEHDCPESENIELSNIPYDWGAK